MKDQDIPYVQTIIKKVFKIKDTCSTKDLVILIRCLYSYHKIFEDAFVEVHDIIVSRLTEFSKEEVDSIVEPVKIMQNVFPNSPLKLYF